MTAAITAFQLIRISADIFSGLTSTGLKANGAARSHDPKAEAALRFARKVVIERGGVAAEDVQSVRAAGYGDAEIVEIVFHVALNTLTNYVNRVEETEIDFPLVQANEPL
ncbi:carboxymuconolactone decarboxylase family protein [Rhizobium lentis]|uniref:carboxymuconolactone decarboxylase family protein n=1 Tax=Rhizobium lentis TaxID=1138194 RepID=UPI00287FA8F7|nr:hypothetical protein [Rhizobium lentis]